MFCFVVQAEKQRAELARELEELGERVDEQGGATQAQVGNNVKMYVYYHIAVLTYG